jgi:hypothetical protein
MMIDNGSNSQLVLGVATANSAHSTDALANDCVIKTLGVSTGRILIQKNSGASAICINSNNYVGIGTTSPVYPLDVAGSLLLRYGNSADSTNSNQITMSWNKTDTYKHAINSRHNQFGGVTNAIDFLIWNSNVAASNVGNVNALSVTAAGVGVFTSNPAYTLDVAGTINSSGNLTGPTITALNNRGVSACTTAVWTSNNHLRLSGGKITGSLNVTNGISIIDNDDTMCLGTNASSFPPVLGIVKKSGYNPHFAFTSNNGTPAQGNTMNFSMLSGSNLSAVAAQTLTTMMTITNAGNVGIGTISPVSKLEVKGAITASNLSLNDTRLTIKGLTDSNHMIYNNVNNKDGEGAWDGLKLNVFEGFVIRGGSAIGAVPSTILFGNKNGYVGVATASPSYKLHVIGDIYASGDVIAYSDRSAKYDLEVISSPLDKISSLTGYTYEMINAETDTKLTSRFAGLIAQEVEEVLPEVVHKNTEGKLSIAYGNLSGLFVEAIKELREENTHLKAENQSLKSRIEIIETQISQLM